MISLIMNVLFNITALYILVGWILRQEHDPKNGEVVVWSELLNELMYCDKLQEAVGESVGMADYDWKTLENEVERLSMDKVFKETEKAKEIFWCEMKDWLETLSNKWEENNLNWFL